MWRPLRYILLALVCSSGVLLLALAGRGAGQATAAQPQVEAAQPDLVIERLIMDPLIPIPGEAVTITVVVKNVGAALGWSEFHTDLYLDPPQRPPTITTPSTADNRWFLGLPAGGSFSWSSTQHFTADGCDHMVYAWVDREDAVTEADETNNVTGMPVCVETDPFEPDDGCAQATTFAADGAAQLHAFAPAGDEDWYRFEGIGGAAYVIAARSAGENAQARLELRTRCDQTASFGGGDAITVTLPTSGAYYIKARNTKLDVSARTAYEFSIRQLFDCSNTYEPNNTQPTANEISTDGSPQRHTFCAPTDEDWIKFAVQAGTTYAVQAVGENPDFAPALYSFDGSHAGAGLSGNPLRFTASADDLYYVRVTNLRPTVYGPATAYTLTVTAQTCARDAFEPDDSQAEARAVAINGRPEARTTCPAGDRDWVKLDVTAGITYTVEAVPVGEGSVPSLCLHDVSGAQITCTDASGLAQGARLTWRAASSGAYFVEVRQTDDTTAGSATTYLFSAVTGLCAPDGREPDNTPDQTSLLSADGSWQAHDFCPAGDLDWVRFAVPEAGAYTIQTAGLTTGSDTQITLFDRDQGQRLAANDDFGPGLAAQLTYTFARPGVYTVAISAFNPARYGPSTSYRVSVAPGAPLPTPTPVPPTPAPTVPPTPQESGIQTLILTNRARLTEIYGAQRVDLLLDKLAAFAAHPAVRGELIQVDSNPAVAAAFATWSAHQTGVPEANQAASAVRAVAMEYLAARPTIQYIVLVGDDRVIPARRVKDRTLEYQESKYVMGSAMVSADTTVGAALANDTFLTDDYYADREPTLWQGAELYLPDLAIGRLVETPEEIGGQLDAFTASSELSVSKALAVGYDFVSDAADAICGLFNLDLGGASVDCALRGNEWRADDLRARQLQATPAFKLQSINGHANHTAEGAPVGGSVSASDIAASADNPSTGSGQALSGAVIYAAGCHAGLNVPETSRYPLDLPQAFARVRANYIGNTGYGWGSRDNIAWTERLMQTYTQKLLTGTSAAIGAALAAAKQDYYQHSTNFGTTDEKVLQQATLYGFPMYRVRTGVAFGDDNPFPSVTISSPFGGTSQASTSRSGRSPTEPGAVAGDAILLPATASQAGKGVVSIHVSAGDGAQGSTAAAGGFTRVMTAWGDYYHLDGNTASDANGPILPQVYADLIPPAGQRLHGAVFTGGAYITTTIDPVISAPTNEYAPLMTEPEFHSDGFYPPVPFILRPADAISRTAASLAVVMGQYDSATGVLRLYNDVRYDVYFSALADTTGPTIRSADGYYDTRSGRGLFKVEADDPSSVTRVSIAYTTGAGAMPTFDLAYDRDAHKWRGALSGVRGVEFSVQAVDGAGNTTTVPQRGGHFRLDEAINPMAVELHRIYLPQLTR